MAKNLFSVSDFIAVFNQTIEYAYPLVEVEGEVASFKVNQGKFVFFDLKDESGTLGCFMTVWQLRVPIEDGMKVIVTASPKLTNWGKFSLTVQAIRPSGEGALKKSFELLRAKLDKEGLFAPERKRPLPDIPRRVAVISSTQAAGYGDFVKILNDRWGGLQIEVAHTQVQGVGAPDQIIRAVRHFNEQELLPEVLVIVRGGGSADDLAVFNDEQLVREIAGSRIPTLVGVGHEVDETLADMVADRRASTPSNAAQILVPDRREVLTDINHKVRSILPLVERVLENESDNVKNVLEAVFEKTEGSIEKKFEFVESMRGVLAQLDPKRVLTRGYAIARGEFVVGGVLEVERAKDIIKAEVKDVRKK